jgi:hypothetical protein
MSTYYTDREYGARALLIDTLDERQWAGLYSLIQTRIGDDALDAPDQIDYLFTRMFAFVRMVLRGTGRGG